jgi:hypothetical protein
MGKKHRQRDVQSTRMRLEQLLGKGDARGAVDAAKQLVREQPGATSEELAVRAYAARIRELIGEGLGREAAALASIVRERFPAHIASQAPLLEEARLAAGDFAALLTELRDVSEERRAAIEERLLPWMADPAALAQSAVLDPGDPLAREARIAAELFEIVTSRLATPEELAPLGEIRRRSPFAPWKLLIRAIDAFHRHEDERLAANLAAIDPRSPAKRAADVLAELTTGNRKPGWSFAAERLIDRISGGRATIAARIRAIESASHSDDRRQLREELRELVKSFDALTPYAREQIRIALLPLCGLHFTPEQAAAMLRIDERALPRFATLLAELAGYPFAASLWVEFANQHLAGREIEPWQAAEIYLHALALGGKDDAFLCTDPTHDHPIPAQANEVLEKVIATRPAPAVLERMAPYLDRLRSKDRRRVLTAWRKADPEAIEPVVQLLRLAEEERRYDDVPAVLRHGDKLKTLDPEYARLRVRLSFRRAEQLLAARKRDAAYALLGELAVRPGDLGEHAATYLLALQWPAAPPAVAGELLAKLAAGGPGAAIVLADVTGELEMPFPLDTSSFPASELLEGLQRASAVLEEVRRPPRHIAWVIERAAGHIEEATEAQLLAIAEVASSHHLLDRAWLATTRGLRMRGPLLQRFLIIRASNRAAAHDDWRRVRATIDAARALAQRANDHDSVARIDDVVLPFPFIDATRVLTEAEIERIVEDEQNGPMPRRARPPAPKKPRRRKLAPRKERNLFEP